MRIYRTDEYEDWIHDVRDAMAAARIEHQWERCLQAGRPVGDWKSEGDGLFAMRFNFGPGYRVYFSWDGHKLLLLLCGGDKTGQEKDIKRAKKLMKEETS